MARIDIKGTAGGGGGSGTVTSVAVSSTTLTVTGSPITSSGTITANIPDGYLKVGTGVTGSLQNVVDTNGTATQLFLSSTGIQATSKIQITTAETSYIDAEDNSGNNRFTVGRDPSSQLVTVDFASLPTALTTPVGAIRTATDGVTLANVMTFLENGNIGVGTDTPGSKFDVHSSGAIVAQFNKTGSGNSYIQQLTAGAGKWKHGFTSSTGAFDIIDDVNSLTRLSLLNTGQLKLNAYTSTSAFTGTTAGFLAFDASGNILSVTSPATSPAGTTGAVQFNNAGAFGADSTNFFWDDTNNRLGVGTNTPTGKTQITESFTTTGNNYSAITFDGTLTSRATASDTIYGFRNNQSIVATALGQTIIANDLTPNYTFFDANTNYVGLKVGGSVNTQNLGSAIWCVQKTTAGNNGLAINPYSTRWAIGMTSATNNNITGCNLVLGVSGIGIGTTVDPANRLTIQGSGSTSATTSLLVQDSAGTNMLQIRDDGYITVGAASKLGVIDIAGTTSAIYAKSYNSQSTNVIAYKDYNGNQCMTLTMTGSGAGALVVNSATNNASAVLQADSTIKGFLPPRMTTAQKNAIGTPAAGLMVYDTDLNKLCVRTAAAWETITSI